MAETNIEWTGTPRRDGTIAPGYTFNIVWGCTKVSQECKFCYAEAIAKRTGHDIWGPNSPRKTMSEKYWLQPLRWNERAARAGEQHKVFCSSMADVFEDHPTNEQERPKLWELIEQTPNLDWLLLTKRPENLYDMLPATWRTKPRHNVWLGTTTGSQQAYDRRIGHLLGTPAVMHFISYEPALSRLDLGNYKPRWVICGGESGPHARLMNPEWAQDVRDQCKEKRIAFFMKQMGTAYMARQGKRSKGHNLEDMPQDLRIREFPRVGEYN